MRTARSARAAGVVGAIVEHGDIGDPAAPTGRWTAGRQRQCKHVWVGKNRRGNGVSVLTNRPLCAKQKGILFLGKLKAMTTEQQQVGHCRFLRDKRSIGRVASVEEKLPPDQWACTAECGRPARSGDVVEGSGRWERERGGEGRG
jgi:hypothetical protein